MILFTAIACFGQFGEARAEKEESPQTQPETQEERLDALRHGRVFTDGGYLKKGVWGEMEGVVYAPPRVVWRLFAQANEWPRYKLPQLIDCRAVSDEVAQQAVPLKKVEDYYKLVGDQVFDPLVNQKSNSMWTNHTFQYFDLPWPVSNKWIVMKNQNDETEGGKGIFRSSWAKIAGNVRTLSGEIRLSPFEGDPQKTLLFYRVETDPGSGVPKFLLKWGVKKSLPAAMHVIRREAIKLANRPSPILKTQ